MKAGDQVKCVDNSDQVKFITIGKTYKIDTIKDGYLRIKDDSNEYYYYCDYRFVIDIANERKKKLKEILK